MDYRRINNVTGWVVFSIIFVIYFMTMAPTASYWDCGEFIACANELEVPHPPGAPFFLMLGRVFALFAFGDVTSIAFMLNLLSMLSSAFTVLFTFWITTHLAKRLINGGEEINDTGKIFAIMTSGAVAAFSCAFATSFWFNAVEAEVYAMSSFFTAVVVWLMFKWEEYADEPGNERWLILIAYLMGLSIGVHLLNLLTIPALAFIYYFKKYNFTWSGFLLTGAVSVFILGVIQTGIILTTFDLAWWFERTFTGTMFSNGTPKSGFGLPFGTGIVIFFILLFAAIIAGIWYSEKIQHKILNTALLCMTVIFVGFSSYLMIPIRSNANPPIDENNPENAQTFLSYMKREQYGDRPLVYGPLYNAQPVDYEEIGKEYAIEPGRDRYVEIGTKQKYKFADSDKKLFPRMYETSRYKTGIHAYVNYVARKGDPNTATDDKPTAREDLNFFFDYQLGHMFWRYLMWNFAGRESFIQDADWESGLNFSETSKMPDFIRNMPTKNHYYMLPFLLGLLGLFWHAQKRGKDATIIGLLFFFTGVAIIIYLNQYPAQPRERDYSFAGSFQTFAIWIGLGVIALYDLLEKYLKGNTGFIVGTVGLIVPLIMLIENWDDHSRAGRYVAPDSAYNLLNSLAPNAIVFTNGDNDTFPLWYLQEVEGVRTDVRVLCLSYVNTDWYINQMTLKVNDSEPLPISLKPSEYVGQANQTVRVGDKAKIPIRLPVNVNALMEEGTLDEEELPYVQRPMSWEVPTRGSGRFKYLELKDKLLLNLLENVAKNNWERPVYFANTVTPSSFLGLAPYLRLEGLAYRILPVKNPAPNDPYDPYEGSVDDERMYTNLLTKFRYRNLDNPNVYYDENVGRMLVNYHSVFYRLSNELLRQAQQLERQAKDSTLTDVIPAELENEARALRDRALEVMNFSEKAFPYTVVTPDPFIIVRAGIMFHRLGEKEKAEEYFAFAKERSIETLKYYEYANNYFKKKNDYMVSLRMLMQHFSTEGETQKMEELQSEMQGLNLLN